MPQQPPRRLRARIRSARAAAPVSPRLLGWLAALALLAAAGPTAAGADTATLRWVQPDPDGVAGFRVHVGQGSGRYTWTIPVGLPSPDASGVYSATVELGSDPVVYVALSSFNAAGWESEYSNEKRFEQNREALGAPGEPQVVIEFD